MCGVFGMVRQDGDTAPDIYVGLTQLQHRAHDSAGIATYESESGRYSMYKGLGEVPRVFSEKRLAALKGSCGIGHVRWTTVGDCYVRNAHPLRGIFRGRSFYVVHNGELTCQEELQKIFPDYCPKISTDTKFIAALISSSPKLSFAEALQDACAILKGTYSLLILYEGRIYAVRDTTGNRPLAFGHNDQALVVASETAAFDPVGCEYLSEVPPGEIIMFSGKPLSYSSSPIIRVPQCMPRKLAVCLLENIYLLRPDSIFLGRTVELVREKMGRKLFEEYPRDGDMVIGIPDSGEAAALGYSYASGIPFRKGLLRSHYAGRMFIEPVAKRDFKLRIKLGMIREIVSGKKIILVDDSVVEGRTSKKIIAFLKDAGAKEVSLLSSSPPMMYPCYYGVATAATHRRLIASEHKGDVSSISQEIGADYLAYLSLGSTIRAVVETPPFIRDYPKIDETDFCVACFTGEYPIPIPAAV